MICYLELILITLEQQHLPVPYHWMLIKLTASVKYLIVQNIIGHQIVEFQFIFCKWHENGIELLKITMEYIWAQISGQPDHEKMCSEFWP